MNKSYKIVIGLFIALLGFLVFLEASKPEPVNWFPSYAETDKIPLGTYIFYENLSEKAQDIQPMFQSPYIHLSDSLKNGTYFFISNSIYIDDAELDKLLAWVEKGNQVFIAADNFQGNLLDTLNIEQRARIQTDDLTSHPQVNLVNPALKSKDAYEFTHNKDLMFFREIDTANQTVLGVANLKEENNVIKKPLVNFIKAPFGKGEILLHSSPEIFSNYFMLTKNNYQYVENVLAYINLNNTIFWDKNYKPGKVIHTSPLYILFSNRYLKWAYYFVIIGAILFVFFEGKRKQKSIKIIPPLKNQTYDYTRTVAGMYLDKKDHKAIAEKQIEYLLYFIRTGLRTDTGKINDEFYLTLAERTKNKLEEVKALFNFIEKIQQKPKISKEELLSLHKKISTFKQNT
ncbi:DUF4350 domain-containing protein [Mesonia aquimarina]|uniref:DUF4350 domain-containing protein n=1 Tax=Mesonia aquimarina TaxID=1504967 RepID=UPI000EF5EA55|nr:DUF4350 domain-containing protein [Mesonia aquimarina]